MTKITPKKPITNEDKIYMFNFSFKKITASTPENNGDDIIRVVYSGNEICLKRIKARKGIGTKIKPLKIGIKKLLVCTFFLN